VRSGYQEQSRAITVSSDITSRQAIRARVTEVVVRRFTGSQRAMARAIGVSQATISQVVSGKKKAGPRFLNAIANLPGISSDWLLLGRGSLPEGRSIPDPARCFLPLYTSLHDAFPSRNQLGPTTHGVNVRAVDFSDTRIVLQLSEAKEWGDSRSCDLRPGDCLIFETDRQSWGAQPRKLKQAYAIHFSTGQVPSPAELVDIRRIETSLEPGKVTAFVKKFWNNPPATLEISAETSLAASAQRFLAEYGKHPRCVQIDSESGVGMQRPRRRRVRRGELVPVCVEDIVAIAVAEFGAK
jgi:transcriptional regulator with XRE-family HTH domain